MYIANSAFEHKGRAYRPGEVLTDNDGCEELIKVGFVVVRDDPDTSGKPDVPDEPDTSGEPDTPDDPDESDLPDEPDIPDETVAPITPVTTIGRNNRKKAGRKR